MNSCPNRERREIGAPAPSVFAPLPTVRIARPPGRRDAAAARRFARSSAPAVRPAGPPAPALLRWPLRPARRPRRGGGRRRLLHPLALVLLVFAQTWAASAEGAPAVLGMRISDASTHTRVVFDLSAPVDYNLFSLRKPDRVVLDLKGVAIRTEIEDGFRRNRRITGIRQAKRNDDHYRVVFDMAKRERARSFLLGPQGRRGHRLVVDFGPVQQAKPAAGRTSPVPGASKPAPTARLRDVVVAIDAGHGGKDPGAIGRRRKTREKHVTLAIAKKLAAELRRRPGIRPVLVRDGDYFIPLRRRTEIARKAGADLFVSIHADAFKNPKVRGASAYVLSWNGASSEAARWLAERENAADRAGGLNLGRHEPMVRSAMVDMSRKGTNRLSTIVANRVLNQMRSKVEVHGKHVHRAGFAVLKTRNIPAVLIETAFLSNPTDEKLLRDDRYQRRIARAIADGIESFFRRQAPVGTRLAVRNRGKQASS